MLMLNWPLVIVSTLVLYILTLITLPFSPANASVFLFAIVALWSRLPGVGMPSPLYILYLADMVDLFSMIVAINVGSVQGVIFTICLNLGSRAMGVFPTWISVVKDAIGQSVACLVIPFIYTAIGGNIVMAMVWYTVIRMLMLFPLRLLPVEVSFPQFLMLLPAAGAAQILINGFYAKLFGNFFNNLMQKGVEFNWILFLAVTVVILVFYVSVFGKSKTIKTSGLRTILRAILKAGKKKKNGLAGI